MKGRYGIPLGILAVVLFWMAHTPPASASPVLIEEGIGESAGHIVISMDFRQAITPEDDIHFYRLKPDEGSEELVITEMIKLDSKIPQRLILWVPEKTFFLMVANGERAEVVFRKAESDPTDFQKILFTLKLREKAKSKVRKTST